MPINEHIKEPPLVQVFCPNIYQGAYFVEYDTGEITHLMSLANARDYSNLFGGNVRRHSQLPSPITRLRRWCKRMLCRQRFWCLDLRQLDGENYILY